MKISQLLNEDKNYETQLLGDIKAYLIRLKANQIFTIDTNLLVKELNDMGHNVTADSLVDMLRNSKYISNVTTDSIDLVGAPQQQGQANES